MLITKRKTTRLVSVFMTLMLTLTLMPLFAQSATAASGTNIVWNGNSMSITWNSTGASSYTIARAGSRLGSYSDIATVSEATYIDNAPNANKYENYYRITPSDGSAAAAQYVSLENQIFGDNMLFYDAKYDNVIDVVNEVNAIHDVGFNGNAKTFGAEFGTMRYGLMFKPGNYVTDDTVTKVGFYTSVYGLGKTPNEVQLCALNTEPHLTDNNATCTFWRSAENVQSVKTNADKYFDTNWSVAQAAPMRRCDVIGNASVDWYWGWASGGFIADSRFSNDVGTWSGQQFYTRNSYLTNGFFGVNMINMMQGCTGNLPANGNSGPNVIEPSTPVIREKPFLYLNNGEYNVFLPALRTNATGTSWSDTDIGQGTSIDISNFYIAQPGKDTSATINAALSRGMHILLTPGIYYLDEPIHVTNSNAIVLGLGYATLVPSANNQYGAMFIDDVDGVTVAGVMYDAHYSSEYLLRVGDTGARNTHASNPTVLFDTICRVGGFRSENVNVSVAVQINSSNVIADHSWIWRADHGNGVGWFQNTSDYGLIVSGNDVTAYGLFSEHFQKYTTLWMGERGRTYFYQNETPYDPIDQNDYMSHNGTVNGYAQYKVADNVTDHYAVGLGIYEVFINTNGASIFVENAIECPNQPNVKIEDLYINSFSVVGSPTDVGFKSAINGTGISAGTGPWMGDSTSPPQGWITKRYVSYVNGEGTFYDRDDVLQTVSGTPPASDLSEIQSDIPKGPSVPGGSTSSSSVTNFVTNPVIVSVPTDPFVYEGTFNNTPVSNDTTVVVEDKEIKNAVIYASNKRLSVGDKFVFMDGVTARDDGGKGKDLTKKVTISGSINTLKAGSYPITYKVKGANGKTVSKVITVTVK